MATLELKAVGGSGGGRVELAESVFEAPLRPHLLHAEVRRQLAQRRAGTHATRNRQAVSGGGAKPYRQKGTGHARQGTRRAPQFAGGGAVFGPVPRSHEHSLNKKARKAALRCALSLRHSQGAIRAVEALELERFSTKRVAELLREAGIERSVLIVIDAPDEKLERSARNLPGVRVLRAAGLNVYDVLQCEELLFTRAGLSAVEARLAGGAAQGAAGAKDVALRAEDVALRAEDVALRAEDVALRAEDVALRAEDVS